MGVVRPSGGPESTEKGSARFGLELLSPDPPAAPAPFCQPQSAGREFLQHPAFLSTAGARKGCSSE